MPVLVLPEGSDPQVLQDVSLGVQQPCAINPAPRKTNIPEFSIAGPFIAYASPDSTYAVTRRLLQNAHSEIMIAIYDFSCSYIKDLLKEARDNGISVTLMLDKRKGEKDEIEIFEALITYGCTVIQAPSCGSTNKYFHSCHEKIIVIDRQWTLIQSGNYSDHGIPLNEKDGGDANNFTTGNREMGIAVFSDKLANFFIELINSDIQLQLAPSVVAAAEEEEPSLTYLLVEPAPKQPPVKLFSSKELSPKEPVRVKPILTPDNFMLEIPELLSSAEKSIYIENQYIRSGQPQVIQLLQAIKEAKNKVPDLDVRIVLGKLFDFDDVKKEINNLQRLTQYDLHLGTNIRYIDTNCFVHCHNKLIIVDEHIVIIGSQNWSDTGIDTNREAGLLIQYDDLAKYYLELFELDWNTGQSQIPTPPAPFLTKKEFDQGNYLKVVAGDYREV